MKYQFPVTRTTNPKAKPDESKLGFGNYFTDHMFVMDYTTEKGWHDGRIVPYGKFVLSPAARVFHYGQEMYEGMKAYKRENGIPVVFRADKHIERALDSNVRMCIPEMDPQLVSDAVNQLVDTDKDWIPSKEGTALYIRPFIIATEPKLSVGPAVSYIFAVILSPVDSYYQDGIEPAKALVETNYIRSVLGGPGYVKVGANCANTFLPVEKAAKAGYNRVLWLDAKERKYVEEIGNANAFFVIGGEVITPPLSGTVLPGVTRDSVIALLKDFGYEIREELISIDELFRVAEEGKLQEVFTTGTSVTVSPVGKIAWKEKEILINDGKIGTVAKKLYDELTGIYTGKVEDTHGWLKPVK